MDINAEALPYRCFIEQLIWKNSKMCMETLCVNVVTSQAISLLPFNVFSSVPVNYTNIFIWAIFQNTSGRMFSSILTTWQRIFVLQTTRADYWNLGFSSWLYGFVCLFVCLFLSSFAVWFSLVFSEYSQRRSQDPINIREGVRCNNN